MGCSIGRLLHEHTHMSAFQSGTAEFPGIDVVGQASILSCLFHHASSFGIDHDARVSRPQSMSRATVRKTPIALLRYRHNTAPSIHR